MIYIDEIGANSLSEVKTGKFDLSAKFLGDNSVSTSFSFNSPSKQAGALHFSFPTSVPDGPVLVLDVSNADKEKGKIINFSVNNINTGLFHYSATADLVNSSLSLFFPFTYSKDYKDFPLIFEGLFRFDFWSKPIPKPPNKLEQAAQSLEEQAKQFQREETPENPIDKTEKQNDGKIDLDDDRDLNLNIDFIHNDDEKQKHAYYNTFSLGGCYTFDLKDFVNIKFKLGAETKLVDGNSETTEANDCIEEEEEDTNNVAQPVDEANPLNIHSKVSYNASLEGNIANSINFLFGIDDEKSTNEVSFPIPRTHLTFGVSTSILKEKSCLNTIGTTLIYNSEDNRSQLGFGYDVDFSKRESESSTWNLGGGILKSQASLSVPVDFHDKLQKPKKDEKSAKSTESESFLVRGFRAVSSYLHELKQNLKDINTVNLATDIQLDFSGFKPEILSQTSFGISCPIPESVAKNAQFQLLGRVTQVENDLSPKVAKYEYSLGSKYSWFVTDKTNLSLSSKISSSSLVPSFGIKLTFKD